MTLISPLAGAAWKALRWAAGFEDAVVPAPGDDDLEPYCEEKVLIERQQSGGELDAGVSKAVRKIGARYGASL